MASVIKRGTGRRALALGRSDIAGKTGTTNEAKDTWRSLGEAEEGARTGLPIWIQFMREALQGGAGAAPQPNGRSTRADPRLREDAGLGQARLPIST